MGVSALNMKKGGEIMDKWEFYKDAQGEWRWRALPPTEMLSELLLKAIPTSPTAKLMLAETVGIIESPQRGGYFDFLAKQNAPSLHIQFRFSGNS